MNTDPPYSNLVDGSSIYFRVVGNTAHIHTVQRFNIRKLKISDYTSFLSAEQYLYFAASFVICTMERERVDRV
jgi:hypothetical protein